MPMNGVAVTIAWAALSIDPRLGAINGVLWEWGQKGDLSGKY